MRTIFFVSIGCDKNLVDSECMLGQLAENNYVITDDESKADVIIVNTCSFIHDAKDESVETILEMAEYKKTGSCKALIVAGCLAQYYQQDILDELPEVDAVLGTSSINDISGIIDRIYEGQRCLVMKPLDQNAKIKGKRMVTTGGHTEYLKIAEGCDKHCTYCIIPKLRGNFRSVPMEELIEEAGDLAMHGITELNIVAQETTVYGTDIYGKKSLHILLEKLCRIEGIRRVRLMYCYPEEIYPELIEVMKNEKRICHYLDLPIQHCNDEILKRMGRRTSRQDLLDIIAKLRAAMPDIILRTSLITGFPGETEEQHKEMLDFVSEVRFDRLGVFSYSQEDGTAAALFEGQIDEEEKDRRREALMLCQQGIAFEKNASRVGEICEVFVEGYMPQDDIYVGRTYGDAPNVDGYIFFKAENNKLESGQYVNCKVTDYSDYDLIGEMLYE